jgi:hypothetical protein
MPLPHFCLVIQKNRQMKNILIPTDFSVSSLEHIGTVARLYPEKINILLFHAFDMPASLRDAISKAGISGHNSLVTEELRMKCKRIKQQRPNINNIHFRMMYGTTNAAFRNFAEANEVHLIALPPGYKFKHTIRESVDPLHMFRRSGIELLSNLVTAMPPLPESDGPMPDMIQLA